MKVNLEETEIIKEDTKHSFAAISSCGLNGINAYPVEIEFDISGGLPNFVIVGLPDTAVNESRERVRSAIKSCGFEFPSKKIIVNLAPADTKKAGPTYDLPIAIGVLACDNIIKHENLKNLWIVGELGLSGKVRQVTGVLSFVILARKNNIKGIIIPEENKNEASLIEGINIFPINNLKEAINIINNLPEVKPFEKSNIKDKKYEISDTLDFNEVKGQVLPKRALEIAASGGHHALMIGPPGSGKSMLAERLITILPPLNHEEIIEVTQIYSIAGKLKSNRLLVYDRPFRSPHHNTSLAGLIGGGTIPHPGEISLAHKGVLFLDEFTEFQKQVLDSLRQGLETKEISISRSKKSSTFPCDFTLISACNPCPCGYHGDSIKKCICNPNTVKKYISKISGPILDRIDLQTEVKRLTPGEIINTKIQESSREIKRRVENAREIQKTRYKGSGINLNSNLRPKDLKSSCKIDNKSKVLLHDAIKNIGLTARGYDRVLKVSRTIADLENSDIIKDDHILEALQFRLNLIK